VKQSKAAMILGVGETEEAPRRISVRARRAHGDVVLSARNDSLTRKFLEEARRWFEQQPDQSLLLGSDVNSEEARWFASTYEGSQELAEIGFTIEFVDHEEPGVRSGSRVVDGEHFPSATALSRRATSRFVIAPENERVTTKQGVAVRYVEGGVVAEVELRPPVVESSQVAISPAQAENLRAIARGLDGVDEDVFDILVANAVSNQANSKGWHVVDVDAVLEARGRGIRRRKVKTGKTYRAGYSDEHREEVVGAVRVLSQLHIGVGEVQKVGRRRLRVHRPLLIIEEYVVDEARASKPIVAIAYRFGEAFDGAGASHVLAPAALLRLNARTEGAQKALGRYLVQRANSRGSVVCQVNDIIEGIGWPIEEGRNRGRIRVRIESALDALIVAGVLRRWAYAEDSADGEPRRFADEVLPSRGWLQRWLDFHIVVSVVVGLETALVPRLQQ
jgi:hypothetical protein